MRKHLDATGYATDKGLKPEYLRLYEEIFERFVDKDIRLLELGVGSGGSLLLWRDYFKSGTIVGLDINPVHIEDTTGRIHMYRGRQQDIGLLDRIATEQAPEGFDIIIDDCSHVARFARISFWHLFEKYLKPGGIYAIEDIYTGYWEKWCEGKNYKPATTSILSMDVSRYFPRVMRTIPFKYKLHTHEFGLAGFVKELMDASQQVAARWGGQGPLRTAKISRIIITFNRAILFKSVD